jgi:hypothetical protein
MNENRIYTIKKKITSRQRGRILKQQEQNTHQEEKTTYAFSVNSSWAPCCPGNYILLGGTYYLLVLSKELASLPFWCPEF